jgi:hypothetical protein
MEKLKKIISVATILICMQTASAQARLGYSLTEISDEFRSDKTYLSGFPKDKWVSVNFSTALIYYSFNDRLECSETYISPNTEEDIQYYINKYNTDYKKTSENTWVIVETDFNIYISLQKTEEGVIFFTWSY